MEQYNYQLSCGSGKTVAVLVIEGGVFTFTETRHWMGSDKTVNTYTGFVKKLTDNYYNLYVSTLNDINYEAKGILNDKISMLTFKLIKFDRLLDIDEQFNEFDGMVMGGASVNTNCQYDTLLTLCVGKDYGAYQPANCDMKKIFTMVSKQY